MSTCCETPASGAHIPPGFRRALWIALAVNVVMFGVEIVAGLVSGSLALLADALDFLGDSFNYVISLLVLGRGVRLRAGAALVKGASMAVFGVCVLAAAVARASDGTLPEAQIMGAVGVLALAANVSVAVLLFRHRGGDANMRSVWLCSRNDAIANVAVLLAALGVHLTGSGWPDLVVAAAIAALCLHSALEVLRQAGGELRAARRQPAGSGD